MYLSLGRTVTQTELCVDCHVLGRQQVLDRVRQGAQQAIALLCVNHLQPRQIS